MALPANGGLSERYRSNMIRSVVMLTDLEGVVGNN